MQSSTPTDPREERRPPVFILGIMPRSGTNYLYNLLLLHPDCAPPRPLWEDFLIAESDPLLNYAESAAAHWESAWGADLDTRRALEKSLGDGISRFLSERCIGPQVVTKTPRVDRIEHFFRLFPDARLLILVRDGRAVVESGVQSFGWNREAALHDVADAAAKILQFMAAHADKSESLRLLRYEDLWLDTEPQLRQLLEFLGLDDSNYDFEQARNLPLRGSSDLNQEARKEIHWDPVERPVDFDPLSRFQHWSDARHFRYNHVAGRVMEKLGYAGQQTGARFGTFHLANFLLDAYWRIATLFRPLYRRLRKR